MKPLKNVVEQLYLESLEGDVEFTKDEREAIEKSNNLFSELKAELSPHLFKKLLAYSDAVGDVRYLQGLRDFGNGLETGIMIFKR